MDMRQQRSSSDQAPGGQACSNPFHGMSVYKSYVQLAFWTLTPRWGGVQHINNPTSFVFCKADYGRLLWLCHKGEDHSAVLICAALRLLR